MAALDNFNHAQKERLAFIDFSLQYFGVIARGDLIDRFQTGLAASTRDFSAYRELAPDNMELRHQTKSYHRTQKFSPLFNHDPETILTGLCRGFGNGLSTTVNPSDVCLDAVRLIHPNAEIIAALTRAIHNNKPIRCKYVSISSGESAREIVPHSIVNNGHRWHVRAFDRKHKQFRDFVCTRFTMIEVMDEFISVEESRHYDEQWNKIIKLQLVAHPSIEHPLAIEMDYGMTDGELNLEIRAALASYLLRQWQVDCSKQHRIVGQGCQLALANHDVLQDVENMQLAPGYGK